MRWIAVIESLPDPYETVLVTTVELNVALGVLLDAGWEIHFAPWGTADNLVEEPEEIITHWMRIPDPPVDEASQA